MIETIDSLVKDFMPFAQERMGFTKPPKLFLKKDISNAEDPLGRTAFYDPAESSITLYITNRHPKDIMRSLSHELVHHTQNCRGDFNNVDEMEEGYAQNDEHLREMEREAYTEGNLCFRDWEDSVKDTIRYEHLQKGETKMSIKDWKNKEVRTLLAEAWGFKFNTLQEFDEFNGSGEVQEEGGAAARTGNDDKDVGRNRMSADRVHEEADAEADADEDAEVQEEGDKPDFLDVDKDGDKEESMKDAADDKNESIKHLQEAIAKMLRRHIKG
tara:strand:- start:81 stop:893 length:813 start_codon:yes stop_codon:yes gene_type:complete